MSKNSELENGMTQLASNLRANYGISKPLSISDMVRITRPVQHNKPKIKYTKYQYLKMQSMSFRDRELYELQLEKGKKHKSKQRKPKKPVYWVKVKFNAGNTKWYQCSKDIQQASGVSAASIAKLGRNGNVTTEVLLKVCKALDCDISDIMEIVRN